MRDAYRRLRIRDGDEWKTAFRTRYGHFEYTVTPFGLSNAPAAFQAHLNGIMADLLDTFVIVHLDDILIFSKARESHERHIKEVLERSRRHKMYAKLSKCEFFRDRVEYLGFIVTPNGVELDPERVGVIQDWPEPASIHDICVFIGFANYYRRFIRHTSRLVVPLNRLTEGIRSSSCPPTRWRPSPP